MRKNGEIRRGIHRHQNYVVKSSDDRNVCNTKQTIRKIEIRDYNLIRIFRSLLLKQKLKRLWSLKFVRSNVINKFIRKITYKIILTSYGTPFNPYIGEGILSHSVIMYLCLHDDTDQWQSVIFCDFWWKQKRQKYSKNTYFWFVMSSPKYWYVVILLCKISSSYYINLIQHKDIRYFLIVF